MLPGFKGPRFCWLQLSAWVVACCSEGSGSTGEMCMLQYPRSRLSLAKGRCRSRAATDLTEQQHSFKEVTYMKAIVSTHYGPPDVLQLEEVAKPVPRDDEVLIKVYATAANAADWHLLRGKPFPVRLVVGGLLKPKHHILGADIAGRVEAVGKDVTQFQPGDEVFGNLSESGWGGFAEYVCAREDALLLKPASLTFEEVAAVPTAALTALQALRDKGQIEAGQKVLIYGASS